MCIDNDSFDYLIFCRLVQQCKRRTSTRGLHFGRLLSRVTNLDVSTFVFVRGKSLHIHNDLKIMM